MRFYIANRLRLWESFDVETNLPLGTGPISFKNNEGCIGCLLVFDSLEAMLTEYPDAVDEFNAIDTPAVEIITEEGL